MNIRPKKLSIAAISVLAMFLVGFSYLSLGSGRLFVYACRGKMTVYGGAGTRVVNIEPEGGPVSTITTLIDTPGDLAVADDGRVFLCGTRNDGSTTTGVVQLAMPDAFGNYAVTDTIELKRDISGIAYDSASSRVFLYDRESAELVVGNAAIVDKLPTSWSTLLSGATDPTLLELHGYVLGTRSDNGVLELVFAHYSYPLWYDHYVIPVSAPGFGAIVAGDSMDAGFNVDHLAPGQTTVDVVGPSGSLVEVVDTSTQTVVGSVTTDLSGSGTAAVSPLVNGIVYGVRVAGADSCSRYLTPTAHWGQPDVLASGATIAPFRPERALGFAVGNDRFALPLELNDAAGVELGSSYPAFLMIGFSSDVVWQGSRAILVTDLYLYLDLPFKTSGRLGYKTVPFPINNNPGNEGVELAFQWWIFDGEDVRVSEVFVATVLADDFVPSDFGASVFGAGNAPSGAPESASAAALGVQPTWTARERGRRLAIDAGAESAGHAFEPTAAALRER